MNTFPAFLGEHWSKCVVPWIFPRVLLFCRQYSNGQENGHLNSPRLGHDQCAVWKVQVCHGSQPFFPTNVDTSSQVQPSWVWAVSLELWLSGVRHAWKVNIYNEFKIKLSKSGFRNGKMPLECLFQSFFSQKNILSFFGRYARAGRGA